MRIFPRSKQATLWARVISRVFDPMLVVPVILVTAVWWALINGERVRFLIFLMLLDVVLPGIVLVWYVFKRKVLSGWDLTDRKERIPVFVFVVVCHLIGVSAGYYLDRHPLSEYLLMFWVLSLVFCVITFWWKISVHVGVMSTLVTFVVLHSGIHYLGLYLLVLLVLWARVEGKYHRLGQAIGGAVVPVVLLPLLWMGLGLG